MTNEKIQDTHLGETGHKIQADMFFAHINNINEENLVYRDLSNFDNFSQFGIHMAENNDPTKINRKELYD